MKWIIVGLGNPGGEYEKTRHNTGAIILEEFRAHTGGDEWEYKKTYDALVAKGSVGSDEALLLIPQTFMNNSGKSLVTLVKSKKQAGQLVVIHDDLDLPLGSWKISFGRGSGGQKGVESIMTTLKTKDFVRIRVGVSPKTFLTGKLKKPKGGDAVVKHILGKFTDSELKELKKAGKSISEAIVVLAREGPERAMNEYNQKK